MSNAQPVTTPPEPPPPAHDGEPQATAADPSAGGYYCAAKRSHKQIAQDIEKGVEAPWPWCRLRAGWGTDHVGAGRCKLHAGATPNGRKSARLRYAELQGAAVEMFARIMLDEKASKHERLRAAENLADRGGSPRRHEVDSDVSRETILERLIRLQQSSDASS